MFILNNLFIVQFIITDKVKTRKGGGKQMNEAASASHCYAQVPLESPVYLDDVYMKQIDENVFERIVDVCLHQKDGRCWCYERRRVKA